MGYSLLFKGRSINVMFYKAVGPHYQLKHTQLMAFHVGKQSVFSCSLKVPRGWCTQCHNSKSVQSVKADHLKASTVTQLTVEDEWLLQMIVYPTDKALTGGSGHLDT